MEMELSSHSTVKVERQSYRFRPIPRVELLQFLELLDERLVLVLQHGDPILQTFDVLLLLAPALSGGLPETGEVIESCLAT